LSAMSKKDAKEVTTSLLLRTLLYLYFVLYVCPRTVHMSPSVLIPLLFFASYLSRDTFERHCAYTHVSISGLHSLVNWWGSAQRNNRDKESVYVYGRYEGYPPQRG
jgi:hypothetical protein